jgi:hypothetical protein
MGLDCGHAGQKNTSSKFSLQLLENRGGYRRWLMGYEWEPWVDINKLIREIIEICEYYRPVGGYGDALLYDLISMINDAAYKAKITYNDRRDNPENKPSNWEGWWLQPLNNSGPCKDKYYKALKSQIHGRTLIFPLYKEQGASAEAKALTNVKRSILNIRATPTTQGYLSYTQANNKIQDDDADAIGMANWFIEQNTAPDLNWDLVKSGGGKIVEVGDFFN